MPMSSPTPEPEPSSSGLGSSAIAGIIIGDVAVLALVVFLIWFMRKRKQQQGTETTPYVNAPQEEISPAMAYRSTVALTTFSDSTTAYALPSPRNDPWKQSWQSYYEQDASYAAVNMSPGPRSLTRVPGSPAELVTMLLPDELLDCLLTRCATVRFRFTISERIGWVSTITISISAC